MILQYITPAGLQKSGLKAKDCPIIRDETILSSLALERFSDMAKDARSGVRSLTP